MLPVTDDGISGWQVCNLSELSGGECNDEETFYKACKAGAILGTLQAGYTDFPFLGEASERIIRREALIGVSITGWMNNPEILFNEDVMRKGAKIVKETNAKVAKMIGINKAARCTVVKPSGNASVILGTASGIHGEHSPRYFRHVQMNDQDDVLGLIEKYNPNMVEDSVWSNTGTDKVVAFPIVSDGNSIYKKDLLGVKQLEFVKKAQQVWIEEGTNLDACVDKSLRHNVSNTITVDDWDGVEQYLFDNREWFAGVSLLSAAGDKAYPQAPFTEVKTAEEIFSEYGDASLFASGLVVDGVQAFNGNLWTACDTAQGWGLQLDPEDSSDLLRRDWVRRAEKFADNFFEGNMKTLTDCLKDCYNLHKWHTINRGIHEIDFALELNARTYVDVDTMGAQACSGGACEITF